MDRPIGPNTDIARTAREVVLVNPVTGEALAPLNAAPVAYADRSGVVAAGGTAQTLMAANAARRGFCVQNNSNAALTISSVGAASTSAGLILQPGQLYEPPAGGAPTAAISILGAATGQRFDAREW